MQKDELVTKEYLKEYIDAKFDEFGKVIAAAVETIIDNITKATLEEVNELKPRLSNLEQRVEVLESK